VRVDHGGRFEAREITERHAQTLDCGAIGHGGGDQDADVGIYERGGKLTTRAEIEEFEFAHTIGTVGGAVVQEIRPVWIRLHEFELCEFAETEAQDLRADVVAFGLGEVERWFGDAGAVHEFGGEDGRAARFGYHGGDGEGGCFGSEEVAEAGLAGRFAGVVAFPGEFGAGVGDCFVEVETLGEEAGGGEKDGEVGEVGGDGCSDAGVLDLDGDFLACGGEGSAVDLTDGSGGDWGVGEGGEEG